MVSTILLLFVLFNIWVASCAVAAHKPVHGILFLIAMYCLTAAILLYFSFEFFAIALAIIYAGATTVLFLFVIMLIDTRKEARPILSKGYFFVFMIFSFIMSLLLPKSDTSVIVNSDIQEAAKDLYIVNPEICILMALLFFIAMLSSTLLSLNSKK